MPSSIYNFAEKEEATRVAVKPWNISTYLPKATPATGLSFAANVPTKISLNVSIPTDAVPRGFDIYTTPQGTALRFIGSGLGSGDEAWFMAHSHASLGSANIASVLTLETYTRPYTETEFTNAVPIPGYYIKRNQPNNDTGAVALVAPIFKLTAGDLLEIAGTADAAVSNVSINAFSFNIREVKI